MAPGRARPRRRASFDWPMMMIMMLLALIAFELPFRPSESSPAALGSTGWLNWNSQNLEREESTSATNQQQFFNRRQHHHYHQMNELNSPALYNLRRMLRQGRLLVDEPLLTSNLNQPDLFHCVDPKTDLYQAYVRQYNRTFHDNGEYGDHGDEARKRTELSDRWDLFRVTLQRAILFNRIVQNDVLNRTNYHNKPEIRNYHFIEPVELIRSNTRNFVDTTSSGGGSNLFYEPDHQMNNQKTIMWYADITDCELGLIKYIVFNIFHLIDNNELEVAHKLATEHMDYLPLFNDDGFEQLANVLVLRLYDRFRADEKMNQLFQWPSYLKKLAAFAYSKRQMSRPDFKTKLALISYAYPAYFKDLKYNWPAANRTADNIRANNEHKKFNAANNRVFANLAERNKRLAIFRQRWSLINQLNQDGDAPGMSILNVQPDWLRSQPYYESLDNSQTSGKLLVNTDEGDEYSQAAARLAANAQQQQQQQAHSLPPKRAYNLTQFSDLTDTEFVAFLSNDFSILDNNKESALYIDRNFPIRQLDVDFKEELALELELRRASLANLIDPEKQQNNKQISPVVSQPGLQLARQVVEELISDVGLPVGPVVVENIKEEVYYSMFNNLSETYGKSYSSLAASIQTNSRQLAAYQIAPTTTTTTTTTTSQITFSQSDLYDERQRRYEQFKSNYGRFLAWFMKEGWEPTSGGDGGQFRLKITSNPQLVAMLRLADMSWLEIKLSLFKICCLTPENLLSLSNINSTLQYLASNTDTLCQPISDLSLQDEYIRFQQLNQPQQQQQMDFDTKKSIQQRQELIALELYYYYCVHFNKHHSSPEDFERKFLIFRRNVDSTRRHSCKRSLTLFEALKLKQSEYLNTVDVLDPRRSFTDDLNLDRFEYFRIPRDEQDELDVAARRAADLIAVPAQRQRGSSSSSSSSLSLNGRTGGISYRRAPFNDLLQQSRAGNSAERPRGFARAPMYSLADKLLDYNEQDLNELTRKYAQNNAARVYELVWRHYRHCMKTLQAVEPQRSEFRQQCKSTVKFADLTRNPSAAGQPDRGDLISFDGPLGADLLAAGRLSAAPSSGQRQAAGGGGGGGPCEFYRQGLEPWAEGLIKQNDLHAHLIRDAKCM